MNRFSGCDDCVNYLAEIKGLQEKVDRTQDELDSAERRISDLEDSIKDAVRTLDRA